MVGATLLGVLFVPVFFVVVRRLLGDRSDGNSEQNKWPFGTLPAASRSQPLAGVSTVAA